ncbi:symmetrical bis(5'-nucleosyl)-tetraphosphatase [Guyparkeria hydrothermalis]|uniref:symmetrical bis(5'-nucleosyl)-tetraphosphatase n=1 Tax=Guyparkeria hydrothermalis TaxID=923 RepID=UPI0020211BB6|nr:symmetrical bis(5'-nucleosyl)-tetraphosphatase [Guyparkeria hydrothermalis]MCL7745241.1 symmetrical bis(5'-nucleosyl)-tetraphosphatase [Guyparkeria hydrothermalis]
MATYAIGDLQGCLDPLEALLERVRFDPADDRIWFVGDLVNRGPQSLEALRFVRDLGDRAITVLGNHDIHLLGCWFGSRVARGRDTLEPILHAEDGDELIDWLRRRPLLQHDAALDWTLVHAGIHPHWTLEQAQTAARETEAAMRADNPEAFFSDIFGNESDHPLENPTTIDRQRFAVNVFTRMRYCHADGRLDFAEKRTPANADPNLTPWFAVPGRAMADRRIVFGHWSTLGPAVPRGNAWGIDQGCLWGHQLTALRLEDEALFAVDCPAARIPRSA